MGITVKTLTIKPSHSSDISGEVDFLIDSGAVYSLVPSSILAEMGMEPYREMNFSLADGTVISRKVGDCYFEYQGDGGPAPVIFGEVGDEPLLGATALEAMGLMLHPFNRELYPMRMLLVKMKAM